MAENSLSRKLAVILHADVVDSTGLVQQDEIRAHQCIQSAFQRFVSIIDSYGGIAHEVRGDALVAEFKKASDAVTAALAFQSDNARCNADSSDDIKPWMRVGLGLGEVVVADGTITGTGVVMAQRLEQLADAGSVCIQGAAFETVPRRMPFEYDALGEQVVKGFDEPVRAFTVRLRQGAAIPDPEPPTAVVEDAVAQLPKLVPDAQQPRILIMPFVDLAQADSPDHLATGITDNIIVALTAFRELMVFAFGTSMASVELIKSPADAYREIGADYVVEGKVQRAGERVRVSAQLLDTREGRTLWAQNYDRDLIDLFDIQDEIAGLIVTSLVESVEKADLKRAKLKSPDQLLPYDLVLKGRMMMSNYSQEGIREARQLYQQAIDLDSEYGPAYSAMAASYAYEHLMTWCESAEQVREHMHKYATRALELDRGDILGHYSQALYYYWIGEYEQSAYEIEQAVVNNPNDYHMVCAKGWILTYTGQLQEGLQCTVAAMRTNPLGADFCLEIIGTGQYLAGDYDQALLAFSKIRSNGFHKLGGLAACYAQMGRMEEASRIGQQIADIVDSDPQQQDWQDFWNRVYRFRNEDDHAHFVEGMRKAGILDGSAA